MIKLTPNGNKTIVRLIPNDEKIGSIIIADSAIEKSTLAEVVYPPRYSYHPNGETKDSILKVGMRVRIPKGNCGTTVLESPEGEEWLAIPEDSIYYTIEEQDNE